MRRFKRIAFLLNGFGGGKKFLHTFVLISRKEFGTGARNKKSRLTNKSVIPSFLLKRNPDLHRDRIRKSSRLQMICGGLHSFRCSKRTHPMNRVQTAFPANASFVYPLFRKSFDVKFWSSFEGRSEVVLSACK